MRSRSPVQRVLLLVLGLMLAVLVAGCGSGGGSAAGPSGKYTAIIDVRTPSEFQASHVEGGGGGLDDMKAAGYTFTNG